MKNKPQEIPEEVKGCERCGFEGCELTAHRRSGAWQWECPYCLCDFTVGSENMAYMFNVLEDRIHTKPTGNHEKDS